MQCVIFVGLQGSGKSAFFQHAFADTHVRINRDMLKTRPREQRFFNLCLEMRQPCVIDNTNATPEERARFVGPAKQAGFTVTAYFIDATVHDALARNAARPDGQRVPPVAIYATAKRLQPPTLAEGFDKGFRVRVEDGAFVVSPL